MTVMQSCMQLLSLIHWIARQHSIVKVLPSFPNLNLWPQPVTCLPVATA